MVLVTYEIPVIKIQNLKMHEYESIKTQTFLKA
jgi:hypothetical protein